MQVPVSLLDFGATNRLGLNRYDVLILVDGDFSETSSELADALGAWIQEGGYLLAFERAAEWLTGQGVGTAEFVSEEAPASTPWIPYRDRETVKQARQISGAIFQIRSSFEWIRAGRHAETTREDRGHHDSSH
jgi:hypothetical protein